MSYYIIYEENTGKIKKRVRCSKSLADKQRSSVDDECMEVSKDQWQAISDVHHEVVDGQIMEKSGPSKPVPAATIMDNPKMTITRKVWSNLVARIEALEKSSKDKK